MIIESHHLIPFDLTPTELFQTLILQSKHMFIWSVYEYGKLVSNHLLRIILCLFLWCLGTVIVRFHCSSHEFFSCLIFSKSNILLFRTHLTNKHPKTNYTHIWILSYLQIFTILCVESTASGIPKWYITLGNNIKGHTCWQRKCNILSKSHIEKTWVVTNILLKSLLLKLWMIVGQTWVRTLSPWYFDWIVVTHGFIIYCIIWYCTTL